MCKAISSRVPQWGRMSLVFCRLAGHGSFPRDLEAELGRPHPKQELPKHTLGSCLNTCLFIWLKAAFPARCAWCGLDWGGGWPEGCVHRGQAIAGTHGHLERRWGGRLPGSMSPHPSWCEGLGLGRTHYQEPGEALALGLGE